MALYKLVKFSVFQLPRYKVRIRALFSHKLHIGKSSNTLAMDLWFRFEGDK